VTETHALLLLDRLRERGFLGGFDCAAFCVDGHYGMRSRRAGEPKSDRWMVSVTPVDIEGEPSRTQALREVLDTGVITDLRNRGRTVDIAGWTPNPEPEEAP
jgi:hypothetical protein